MDFSNLSGWQSFGLGLAQIAATSTVAAINGGKSSGQQQILPAANPTNASGLNFNTILILMAVLFGGIFAVAEFSRH